MWRTKDYDNLEEYRRRKEEFFAGDEPEWTMGRRTGFRAQENGEEDKVSDMNRGRLLFGFGLLLVIFMALILRMGYIQIVCATDYREKATAIQTVDTGVDSTRGIIYDSKGNILAETVTGYELYGYTSVLYKSDRLTEVEKETTVKNLAKITGADENDVKELLSGKENLVLLGSNINQDGVDKAKKYWGDNVIVKTKSVRSYPNGAFASQLIGNLNSEGDGIAGLEAYYNSELRGTNGRVVKKTDNNGNTISTKGGKYYQPQNGSSIVTTIDSVIQQYVEEAIAAGKERTGAESITCIVSNPKTGDILAYAETNEYDPNNPGQPSDAKELAAFKNMSDAEQSEYLSRMWTIEAVSSVYEPGSTFKLVAASAGLELGTVTDGSSFYCNKTFDAGGITLSCLGKHGSQDIKEAVGNSCNAALGRVAMDMGGDNIYRYVKLYGLANKTGIDLPGEGSSLVKDPSVLVGVDLATMGFGQGVAVTPIQLLMAVNAMGNNGILMKPKVVKQIVNSDGKVVEEIEDTEVRQVITKETADKMREIMEYYVSDAGGDEAYIKGYKIGGKTGTANIATGGGYSADTDTSFIAMAPMDDPVISMLVIVHKPTKVQYGNNTAGPIVKDIMAKALPYLGVEQEGGAVANNETVEVPNVTGIDSNKAIEALKEKGLSYKISPAGTTGSFIVQDQNPKAGSVVVKGKTVYIYSK
ncbi:MAG: PASTA domain-containing protein [Mogibacterium sp.]|nr:PASTA domain-containing protein [Mogibacterium sp.]